MKMFTEIVDLSTQKMHLFDMGMHCKDATYYEWVYLLKDATQL